ncbi:MAG: LpxD N-terminal domain-containing protein, partial [Cyanobium sp.]
MRFSELLIQLSEVNGATPRHLGHDPELSGAESIERATAEHLSFLEAGSALSTSLSGSGAAALLLPARGDDAATLQQQATNRGIAWVALLDPRLGFAEALDQLYPRSRPQPGVHPSAVVEAGAELAGDVHLGAHVVVGSGSRLAEGCVLHPNVVIYGDVEIGPGCEIHAGAVLH